MHIDLCLLESKSNKIFCSGEYVYISLVLERLSTELEATSALDLVFVTKPITLK